jgi:phosphoesterase RecJ-like protein
MNKEFQQAKNLIDKSQNILLTMHERMDGDDGGSMLAIFHHLSKKGKRITCAIKKGVPPQLKFLPGSEQITDDIETSDFDLLITFGCSELSRTGSTKIAELPVINYKLSVINFDHHPDNSNFADVNIVDPAKSSVAEMVYDFFQFHNWPITAEVATCLLTGIITDTGSFMHSNTKNSTLKAAAQLMRKGASANRVNRQARQTKNPKILKAWGKALENSYYDKKHKIIYAVMADQDLQSFGQLPQSAFEGFVETLNTFQDAKFAMFLRQDGNLIKGSLRSDPHKNTDVSQIAKIFGGGGHKMAAGFSLTGKLTRDEGGKWKVV